MLDKQIAKDAVDLPMEHEIRANDLAIGLQFLVEHVLGADSVVACPD
ncbi:hypothetical protein [Mesorhizobium sp.]|nr:hypothetical protein [Mesorhizobium sp.]